MVTQHQSCRTSLLHSVQTLRPDLRNLLHSIHPENYTHIIEDNFPIYIFSVSYSNIFLVSNWFDCVIMSYFYWHMNRYFVHFIKNMKYWWQLGWRPALILIKFWLRDRLSGICYSLQFMVLLIFLPRANRDHCNNR